MVTKKETAARVIVDEAMAAAVKLAATAAETAAKLAATAAETASNLKLHQAECLLHREANTQQYNDLKADFKNLRTTQAWMLFTTIGTLLTAVGGLFMYIIEHLK